MTKFLNGPAAGVTFMLRRAPHYLRVVRNAGGEWDALDQLSDTPSESEELFAYVMVGAPSRMHVCARGKHRSAGGWYEYATYQIVEPQPTDAQLRSTKQWRTWTSAMVGKPIAEDGTIAEE